MQDDSVVPFRRPGDVRDEPIERLRSGARRLLEEAIAVELEDFLSLMSERRDARSRSSRRIAATIWLPIVVFPRRTTAQRSALRLRPAHAASQSTPSPSDADVSADRPHRERRIQTMSPLASVAPALIARARADQVATLYSRWHLTTLCWPWARARDALRN